MMKFLKTAIAASVLFCGMFLGTGQAAPAYYQPPAISTTAGGAIMWLVGSFEFHTSTNNGTSLIIVSSTGGIRTALGIVGTSAQFSSFMNLSSFTATDGRVGFGLVTNTATVAGLLSGTSAQFTWMTVTSMTATDLIRGASIYSFGTIFSSSGFVGGGSTFTTVNITNRLVFADGSVQTVAATGGGGSSVVGSSATQFIYQCVLGTTPVYGAQVVSTGTEGFNFAISSVSRGLANQSSGTVFVQAGNYYNVQGVTVPVNLNLVFAPGAVINVTQGMQEIFINSGTISGLNLNIRGDVTDVGQKPFLNPRNGGKFYNLTANIVMNRQLDYTYATDLARGVFQLHDCVDCGYWGVRVSSFGRIGTTGLLAIFSINQATRAYLVDTDFRGAEQTLKNDHGVFVGVYSGNGIVIDKGYWESAERFLNIWSNPSTAGTDGNINGLRVTNIFMKRLGPTDTGGQGYVRIIAAGVASTNVSSTTYFAYNTIITTAPAGSNDNFIRLDSFTGAGVFGQYIVDNQFICQGGGSSTTAFVINSGNVRKTVFSHNDVIGCNSTVISDAGSGTVWAGNGNTKDGVLQ